MFFLGRNFVSGLLCTPNLKKTVKTPKTFFKLGFFSPGEDAQLRISTGRGCNYRGCNYLIQLQLETAKQVFLLCLHTDD